MSTHRTCPPRPRYLHPRRRRSLPRAFASHAEETRQSRALPVRPTRIRPSATNADIREAEVRCRTASSRNGARSSARRRCNGRSHHRAGHTCHPAPSPSRFDPPCDRRPHRGLPPAELGTRSETPAPWTAEILALHRIHREPHRNHSARKQQRHLGAPESALLHHRRPTAVSTALPQCADSTLPPLFGESSRCRRSPATPVGTTAFRAGVPVGNTCPRRMVGRRDRGRRSSAIHRVRSSPPWHPCKQRRCPDALHGRP